jgi:quercetin dioxygenase-like cupin family protein
MATLAAIQKEGDMAKTWGMPLVTLCLGLVLGTGATQLYAQQQGGIKRTPLQKSDLVDLQGREAVMGIAEIPAGGAAGAHTHPGAEIGYVLEGTGTLVVAGQPDRRVKAGDSWVIDAGKVHDGRASAEGPMKVLAVYVVEKGKPLATPASK